MMEIATEHFIATVRDGIIERINRLETKIDKETDRQQKLMDTMQTEIRNLEHARNRQEGRYAVLVVVASTLISLTFLVLNHWIGKLI